MAYVNKEKKAAIAAALKLVVPNGYKYSLAVQNHSTIVMTIYSAPVDLLEEVRECYSRNSEGRTPGREVGSYFDVNPYHFDRSFNSSLPVITGILEALNFDNHDRSDIQSDYFDVGHYVCLRIGTYAKPFVCTK